jgi:hypothetical protein
MESMCREQQREKEIGGIRSLRAVHDATARGNQRADEDGGLEGEGPHIRDFEVRQPGL